MHLLKLESVTNPEVYRRTVKTVSIRKVYRRKGKTMKYTYVAFIISTAKGNKFERFYRRHVTENDIDLEKKLMIPTTYIEQLLTPADIEFERKYMGTPDRVEPLLTPADIEFENTVMSGIMVENPRHELSEDVEKALRDAGFVIEDPDAENVIVQLMSEKDVEFERELTISEEVRRAYDRCRKIGMGRSAAKAFVKAKINTLISPEFYTLNDNMSCFRFTHSNGFGDLEVFKGYKKRMGEELIKQLKYIP